MAACHRANRHLIQITNGMLYLTHHLAEGKTNVQIAEISLISPKTVDHHVSAILGRLGASNRGEAVALARAAGLLS